MTNWIKMRRDLRHDSKVIRMTRFLCGERCFMDWWSDPVRMQCRESVTEIVTFAVVTRVTVTGLLDVWASLNETMDETGILPDTTLQDLDDIAEIPGFGEAMLSVGWVEELENGDLYFPNFTEYNTVSKKRTPAKSQAERAKAYRDRKRAEAAPIKESKKPVTNVTARHAEKRREEKRVTPSSSPQQSQGGGDGELPFPPNEPAPTKAELDRMKQPTTDEARICDWSTFPVPLEAVEQQVEWALLDQASRLNGSARILTKRVVACLYRVERYDGKTLVAKGEGRPLDSPGALPRDVSSYVKGVAANPQAAIMQARSLGLLGEDRNAPVQSGSVDVKTEPAFNWRRAAGILNGTGVETAAVWSSLPESRRRIIATKGADALAHPEKYSKAARA